MSISIDNLVGSINYNNLIVDNNGNLGIGTLTPSQKLYINGKVNMEGLLLSKENLVGIVGYFARNTAPEGWLKCNGANISRTTYTALFNAIGTTFGSGDGSTFGIPDLRGKFIRGWDDGRGIDSGRSFGNTQISSAKLPNNTFTTDNPGTHRHTSTQPGIFILKRYWFPSRAAFIPNNIQQNTSLAGSHSHTITGGGDAETRPKNVALLACIKY